MVLVLQLFWGCLSHGRSAELPEQLDEGRALGLRETSRGRIHRRLVNGEYLGGLPFARRRQPNDASSSVARVGLAGDETQGLESIDRRGDRSTGELDSPTNLIDGLRTFVEEHL